MSKKITRTELESIGQNWLDRRNRLLEYAINPETDPEKSQKALYLAFIMKIRLAKVVLLLGQQKAPKEFPSGGVSSNIKSMQPGEYVIAKINRKP